MTARVLVVAGTGSGVGKTSITVGLARALARRGLRVRAAKVGPDFLDPTHLTQATGRPCLNLDLFMMGDAYVRGLVDDAVRDVDLFLVEGVMGLFDGIQPETSEGSTAEVARTLSAPVLLIADASGQARSFAATIHGFTHLEPGLQFAGIVANRVGSEAHGRMLSAALSSLQLPSLVAAIPAGALPHLGSRHLGLIAPTAGSGLDALAGAVEASISLEAIVRLAQPWQRSSTSLRGDDGPSRAPELAVAYDGGANSSRALRLAVAHDAAFGFVYEDFRQAVMARGVEWIPCSPLRDSAVPPEADALFLPGGYPEEHAAELADNRPFLSSLVGFAARRPIYAECGGLMYLGASLVDRHGQRHSMANVLPLSTRLGQRAARLGYAEVTLIRDSLWGRRGEHCRGHEFHYSYLDLEPPDDLQRSYSIRYRKHPSRFEGFQRGMVLASYVHLHLPSRPGRLQHLIKELAR